jgi:hypothetical protein
MAQMTDEDYYESRFTRKREGQCSGSSATAGTLQLRDSTYNSYVRPVVRRYSTNGRAGMIGITLTRRLLRQWTWEQRVLDIKGDG